MNGKTVINYLEKAGFKCARIRGSHFIMIKNSITCPIPVHGSRDLAIGTLKKIEKITGISLSKHHVKRNIEELENA